MNRHDRTKYALISMGPSLLAAAFTTICSAAIMFLCIIRFFTKFATILFFTILMATIGSFIVFITLTDCFGPSQPTWLVDKMATWWMCCCQRRKAAAVASGGEENAAVEDTAREDSAGFKQPAGSAKRLTPYEIVEL